VFTAGVLIKVKVTVVTVAQVFGKNVWARDIGWPVVRHCSESERERGGDEIKGCFERVRHCALRVA
jgi:hypothetical protein